MLNEIPSPWLIPVPHSPAPDPGFTHVVFPPAATFQPFWVSSCCAVDGENAHGLNEIAAVLTSGLGGDSGIGPQVGSAVLYRNAWIQPCWSIRCWKRAPEVRLPEDVPHRLAAGRRRCVRVEVQREVVERVARRLVDRVALAGQRIELRRVLGRDVPDRDRARAARLLLVVDRGLARERELDELGDRDLRRSRPGRVRHQHRTSVGAEARELHRPVDHAPQRRAWPSRGASSTGCRGTCRSPPRRPSSCPADARYRSSAPAATATSGPTPAASGRSARARCRAPTRGRRPC